jgi:aminopeptidase N
VIYDGYPQLFQLMNAENYNKGGLFLHALRQAAGEVAFFSAIRKYYARFKHGNAATADFQAIAEAESRKDLDTLFTLWLHRPGLPE